MKEKSSNGKGKISNNRYWGQPFQERLRDLLYSTTATLDTMAEAMGVKRQTLSKYRDGENVPDVVTLGRMADYFGVSADYLLGRTSCRNGIQILYSGVWKKSEQKQTGIVDCKTTAEFEIWKCSHCNHRMVSVTKPHLKFCPNCGAKMDEEANDDKARP